jgi:hypothetical protein
VRALAAVVAVLFAAGLAVLVGHADDGGGGFGGIGSTASVEAIGPLPGVGVPGYVDERRQSLAVAVDTHVAVVSFEIYATADQARELVDGIDVASYLVAAPAGAPEVVDSDLDRWTRDAREAAVEERKGLESVLRTTDDPEFRAQFEADIDRLRRLERALGEENPVVFGVVVKASSDELRAIASSPGIRLVDIGSNDVPDPGNVRGLRPEEVTRAGEPATRPG